MDSWLTAVETISVAEEAIDMGETIALTNPKTYKGKKMPDLDLDIASPPAETAEKTLAPSQRVIRNTKFLHALKSEYVREGTLRNLREKVKAAPHQSLQDFKLVGDVIAKTTPYNPRSDGQAEHTNRVIEDMLTSFVDANVEDWDLYATNVEFAINDSRCESTSFTPFELVFGFSPLSQLDMFLEAAQSTAGRRKGGVGTAHEVAAKFSSQLRDARQRLELAQQQQREQFDRRHGQREYAIEDLVWVEAKNLIEKHRLKPYTSGKDTFAARDHPAIPEVMVVDGQKEAHVERILARRQRRDFEDAGLRMEAQVRDEATRRREQRSRNSAQTGVTLDHLIVTNWSNSSRWNRIPLSHGNVKKLRKMGRWRW
eukprot:gene4591-biopygen4530